MLPRILLIVTAVLGWSGATAAQSTAATASKAFTCEQPTAELLPQPPQPKLTPEQQALLARNKAALAAHPDCPEGTVVVPRPLYAERAAPPLAQAAAARAATGGGGASTNLIPAFGANYGWTTGQQTLDWRMGTYALFGWQSNEKPYVAPADGHSLSQLWGYDTTTGWPGSTEEIGWTVTPGMFGGNAEPHLFVYHWDGNQQTCYNACGDWRGQTNVVGPGSVLTHNDVFHLYGIQRYGTNWWFYYDGYWIGYLPQSAWRNYWNSGFTQVAAGGEVAASSATTCTDMGSWLYGHQSTAAMWQQVWIQRADTGASQNAQLYLNATDPAAYDFGFAAPGATNAYQFRYGGPGWC